MSSKESNKKPSGKTDSAATAAEKSVDATNRAFEVLRFVYGKATNVVSFKESAYDFCIKDVGLVAQVIQLEKLYVPAPPVRPPDRNGDSPFAAANDPDGIDKARYLSQLRIYDTLLQELKPKEVRLYGLLWSNCSKESKEQIERFQLQAMLPGHTLHFVDVNGNVCAHNIPGAAPVYENWKDVKERADVLSLVRRINATHLAPDVGVPELSRFQIKNRHEKIQMYEHETVLQFKNRFVDSMDAFTAVGLAKPIDEEQAARFINSLHDSRFYEFKVVRANWAKNKVQPYPKTLADAFESASTWKSVDTPGSGGVGGTTFITHGGRGRGGRGGRGGGRGNGKSGRDSGSDSDKTDKSASSSSSDKSDSSSKDSGKSEKNEKPPSRPCDVCGEMHWIKHCPIVAATKKSYKKTPVNMVFSRGAVDTSGVVLKTDIIGDPVDLSPDAVPVLLDNQAKVSVFADSGLLTNIRPADYPCTISGISSDPDARFEAVEVGDFLEFKNIYLGGPGASANILSFSQTKEYCSHEYDPESDTFTTVTPSGKSYSFESSDGLYVHSFPVDYAVYSISTVSEQQKLFSQREQADADKAKDLSRAMGYPSPQSLIDMLNAGSIINCPVSSKDVARAQKIYGPDLGALRGKSKRHKVKSAPLEFLPREVASDLVFHTDIMFVNSVAFLLSVTTPLGLTTVSELGLGKGSRSLKSVRTALFSQLATYASRGFVIKAIKTDPEGSLIALTEELGLKGIVVNPAGAGSHVPVIENKIMEVKNRSRGIKNTLPYRLALFLITFLVLFCVSRINLVPHRAGLSNLSPAEAFRGRKVDYSIDLRVGFGEYCEVFDPKADNSMRARTQACISLLPLGNTTGTVQFLNLATGKTVKRDQFKVLPCSDFVIQRMNEFADLSDSKYPSWDSSDDISSDVVVPESDLRLYDDDTIILAPDADFQISESNVDDGYQPAITLRGDPFILDPPENDFSNLASSAISIEHDIQPQDIPDNSIPDEVPSRLSDSLSVSDTMSEARVEESVRRSRRNVPRVHWDRKLYGPPSRKKVNLTNSKIFNLTIKKAMKLMPKAAVEALFAEILQLHEKNVLLGVKPSFKIKKKIIKSFLFLKEKFLSTGIFDKLKARLVAGGNMQDRSEMMYEDISSPTASLSHLMTIASIAARDGRHVKTVDIAGAYLNADISKHEIYMELDPTIAGILVQIDNNYEQFLKEDGSMIVQLNKALYGCVESAKLWYDLLSTTLISDGFIANSLDPCVFNKQVGPNQCTVVIYVDDLFISCKDKSMIEDLENTLKQKFKEITVHEGLVHSYLGMTWDFSIAGSVKVTMEGYIRDLLKEASVSGTVTTPATNNLFNIRNISPLDAKSAARFHTLVAKLLYLGKRTRPDILLAVSFLSTRVTQPDSDDESKLDRVLKYLNGSQDLGIFLRADSPAGVKAYVDASYGTHSDAKSHSGLYLSVGSGPIISKSTKQKLVTKSSTEAELVAESDFASEALASKSFLEAQGEDTGGPATIFQDNMSTIALLNNGVSKSDRTRHINVRYFWTKERIDSGELAITYVPTDDMIADILTKPLQGEKFFKLRQLLLNWTF